MATATTPIVLSPAGKDTKTGRVTQVIGSTFDAEFGDEHLPAI